MLEQRDQLASSNLWDHLALILKWKKLFAMIMLITAVIAVIVAYTLKEWYYSDAQIMPPPQQMLSLMGGLLPSLDMGLLGQMGGMTSETRLIAAILESRRLQDMVIDEFGWMEKFHFKYREGAYKHFLKNVIWESTEAGTIYLRVNDTDRKRVAEIVNFILHHLTIEYTSITAAQAGSQRQFISARVDSIEANLRRTEQRFLEFQQETGIIAGEEQMAATVRALSNIQSELILAEVQAEVLEKTMPASSSMVIQARAQAEALRKHLEDMKHTADDKDRSIIIGLDEAPEAGVAYLRLLRELEIQQKVLEVIMPLYEQSKIFENEDAGMLYILDRGEVPEKKYKPKRAFLILAILVLGFILTYLYVLFIEWYNRLQQVDQEQYAIVRKVLVGLKPKNLLSFKE